MSKFSALLALVILVTSCQIDQQETESGCDFQSILSPDKNIDCGYLTVPENHDDPDSKKIKIAYVILHAEDADSKEYPVIYLSGGPGSSAIDSARINRWYSHPFRAQRDIILLDQRGIGYSSPLPNLYMELNDIMAKDLTAEEEQLSIEKLMVDYAQKCKEQQIDLANYNTFQNAMDVGALMDRLAYEKYNLYGVSYGTRLARVTQDMFPERLNSVTLNSPNPIKGDMLVDRLNSYSLALSRV
ncbi:MAG: alpha/beta fold hydrolase, partial [Cyclobacteriaceae bacterium]